MAKKEERIARVKRERELAREIRELRAPGVRHSMKRKLKVKI